LQDLYQQAEGQVILKKRRGRPFSKWRLEQGLTKAMKTNDGKKVDVHFPTTLNRTIKFDWDNAIKPKQEDDQIAENY